MSPLPQERTFSDGLLMSASLIGRVGSSVSGALPLVLDVTRRLVLLSGIGTTALPSWDPRTRRSHLWVGLAGSSPSGPSGHAISPHPSSREGHLPPLGGARVSSY